VRALRGFASAGGFFLGGQSVMRFALLGIAVGLPSQVPAGQAVPTEVDHKFVPASDLLKSDTESDSLGDALDDRLDDWHDESFLEVGDLEGNLAGKGRRRRLPIPEDQTRLYDQTKAGIESTLVDLGISAEESNSVINLAIRQMSQELGFRITDEWFENAENQAAFQQRVTDLLGEVCDTHEKITGVEVDPANGQPCDVEMAMTHKFGSDLGHASSRSLGLANYDPSKHGFLETGSRVGSKMVDPDSMQGNLNTYNTNWDEDKGILKNERTQADTEMDLAKAEANNDMKMNFDEMKAEKDQTFKEAKDEVKYEENEYDAEEDAAFESIDEQNEEWDERTVAADDALKKEQGTLVIKVNAAGNAVNAFEKESAKSIQAREKAIEKYGNKAEKVADKNEAAMEKIGEKTLKAVGKGVKVVEKEESKAVAAEEKKGIQLQTGLEKKIKKESKENDKLAKNAQKDMQKGLKEALKGYSDEVKAGEKILSNVDRGKDIMKQLEGKFDATLMDSKAGLTDDLAVSKSNFRESSNDEANTLLEQTDGIYSDSKEAIASGMESLRKTLKDGSKGMNALKQAAAQSKSSMGSLVDEAGKGVESTERLVAGQSKNTDTFTNTVLDADQFLTSALNSVSNSEYIAAKETKKVVSMNKARMLALAQSFSESNKQPAVLGSEARDMKDKASDELLTATKALMEKLIGEKSGHAKQLNVAKREAQDLASATQSQAASVAALQQQDVGSLNRDLASAQKNLLQKVTSLNNTVDTRLVQMTLNFLKKASNSAKDALKERGEATRDEVKDAAGKRDIANEEDLKQLMDLIQAIDSKDQMNSEEVAEKAAQLAEKLSENAEVIKTTQATNDAANKFNMASQESMGEGAVAALGLRSNTLLSGVMAHSDSMLAEKVAQTKADESRVLGKAKDAFTTYLGGLKDRVEEYFRKNLNKAHEKEQEMAEGAQKESEKITQGGRDVEGVYSMLENLGLALQTDAVKVERDTESSLGKSRRDRQSITDEAKDGINQEVDTAKTGLSRVEQVLNGILAGYGQDAQAKDQALENEEARSEQAAQAMLAAILGNMDQNINQISAKDKASMVALQDGLKRWGDAESNAETKEGIFERNIMSRNAKPTKAAGLKASTEISEDRAEAGLNSLGSETKDLGEDAESKVAMAGSESETQAKASGISTEMRLQGIESQEERAYEMQDARDHALANAVGQKLQDIRKVQLDAGSDQKYVQFSVDAVRNLLNTELSSLQQNTKYLDTYQQQQGELVTQELGNLVALMMKTAHGGQQQYADIQGRQGTAEMRLAEIQGSAAFQTLSKIQSADDYSLQTMMDNEVLEQWMQDFQAGADVWRDNVEKNFREHEEAQALHAEEIRKTDEEHKKHREDMEKLGTSSIEGMLGTMKVIPTDEIENGFDQGMQAYKAKEAAVGELDEERIKNLLATQQALKGKMADAIDAGNGALRETLKQGGGGAQLIKMRAILRRMADMHDAEVEAKLKGLRERQARFDEQLLLATLGGNGNGTDEQAPETSQAQLDALVEEAHALTQKHTQLEQKRINTGEDISKAFGQLIAAMQEHSEQSTQPAPSTLAQLRTGAATAANSSQVAM